MKSINNNKKAILFYLIIGMIFCARIINLDADIPAWGMVNYQPMDEGQYATMALNKINWGTIRPDISIQEVEFKTAAHIRNNVIGNLFVYIGMKIMGDNYYGFRIASVFFGGLNFVLFVLNLKNINKRYATEVNRKWTNLVQRGIIVVFLLDFVYTVACRVVETTIYRMVFLQLIVLFFTVNTKSEIYEKKIRFFIVGFLSVISIFAVYITNIFVFAAILLTIFILGCWKGKCYFWNAFSNFVAGSGVAYVLCDLYYNLVWKTSCIVNTMEILEDFSGTKGYTGGNSILKFLVLVLHFISANSNLYNIGVFFLFTLFIPVIFVIIYRKKYTDILFFSILITMMLLQTLINEDYIVRKYTLIYPLILYLIYCILILCSNNRGIFEKFYKRILYAIYTIICFGICIGIILQRLYFVDDETYLDFSANDKKILILQSIFLLIGALCLIVYLLFKEKKVFVNSFLIILVIGSVTINGYFGLKYVYFYDSYSEKEVMQGLSQKLDDEYVYGMYSIAYTLYNEIRPVVNSHSVLCDKMKEKEVEWYIDYSDYGFPDEMLDNKKVRWNEDVVYKRNFSTFGKKRNVSLYRIE